MKNPEADRVHEPQDKRRGLRILALEPFGGDSHAALFSGWRQFTSHEITVLDLPATHWKWRSRHSALTLARQANALVQSGQHFDVVFCSDMLNLPEWKGFVGRQLQNVPSIVYFHENQFTYPLSPGQQRDYHFGYSNVLTALAADSVVFNSAFHREQFAAASVAWLKRMPDYRHVDMLQQTLSKSAVLPPGINPPDHFCPRATDETRASIARGGHGGRGSESVPNIGWVARWEHDKRPDRFLALVKGLIARDVKFGLVLLGQQFRQESPDYNELLRVAGERIRHAGYAPTQDAYWEWLAAIDVVVSTADHEFYGIAMAEAMYAGAIPVLPHALAYPELLDLRRYPEHAEFMYSTDEELLEMVSRRVSGSQSPIPVARRAIESSTWQSLAPRYDALCNELAAKGQA